MVYNNPVTFIGRGRILELSRFSRSEMLIGADAVKHLSECHVAVFGIGGVGSYVAEALARGGVGEITVVDNDEVAMTNINRQLCALTSTIGKKKTEVASERIRDINPDCRVHVINGFYLPDSAEDFFPRRYDYIADAVDTVQAKLSLAEEAQRRGIPIISCMGTGNKLDPTQFCVSDISKTSVCPLCRVMRRELRARGIKNLKVVWSPEKPIKPNETAEETTRRALPGSISFVPPVAGMIMAGEIIKDLIK